MSEESIGYPAINVRIFKDENGNNDTKKQKLVNEYLLNWQDETETYNGRMGITAKIPDFFQSINESCPKWTKEEIKKIRDYIEENKVIPSLNFVPDNLLNFTKQVWWLVPFVIWQEKIASWVFIDKNGIYAPHQDDNDGVMIFSWDKIDDLDLEWEEDNLVVLTLENEDGSLTFSEFVGKGMGSYLSVIESIYNVYKKTIEVSADSWYHGAGGEGYQGFETKEELLDEKIWKAVKPTNPALYGYVPPKIVPKIVPELKTFHLTNTECSVPPFDEWKLNEYIEVLLESSRAKPLFWKNDDGIYLMFPTPGLLISADTDDEEEQNYLKFLASNVPNKHFDLGYTFSHQKDEYYETIYNVLIANNVKAIEDKIDIGKVTVTTDKEIKIIAQVFLKRDGLEWSIEGEENKGEYIKYDSGISYQGEAKDGKSGRIPHGKGEMTVADGPVITGEFKDGLADGNAKMDFLDGEVYEGEFKENKKHGKGIYVWPNGKKYEGEYQKGEEHGNGTFTYSDGNEYEGEWENGKKNGKGVYVWKSGNKYEGEYQEGEQHGNGSFTYSDGNEYEGEWENGKENGSGTFSYADGAIYEGYWYDGEIDGQEFEQDDGSFAVEKYKYTSSHKFIFEGVFTGPKEDNQRTTEGTITIPNGLKINLKDCEKYVDKDLTDSYTEMRNTYKSHTFEYDDTQNGILSFERVSKIFGDCSNEEELSFEADRVYGISINNDLQGYVILHAQDDEIQEALEEERDIENDVIIKSDNIDFVETLVEMLKLNNREENGDQVDILEFDKASKEEQLEDRDDKSEEYSEDVYYSEDDLESMWEQIEEWEFFDEPENYGELIIVTVPVDSPPNLNNWQFQLSLTNTIEDKIKFEKRTGLIADKERLPFALENEIVVMVYNEEWRSVTFFSKTKDDEDEEVIKEAPVEEVREEASAKEEVSTKEDVDSIQSFRNFMKEKFPTLKLPKNKPYAGIDLRDGYSINFHVQKKAVVLSFRSVKTDPEEIINILNEKGLNGKDIGDGHTLEAQAGKRNPSIITMNIEITYSSEDELASDDLRENVRSYFEKFLDLFNFNKS
jgi:hypothetical protein